MPAPARTEGPEGTGGPATGGHSTILSIYHKDDNGDGSVCHPGEDTWKTRNIRSFIPIIILAVGITVFAKKYILTDEYLEKITAELKARRE